MAVWNVRVQLPRLNMPTFTCTILKSFKDCLSRQVAEAIKIHYSKNFILKSKIEYNSNHLSRVVVEEDAFLKKKRARQEELEEVMEKIKWQGRDWQDG